MMDNAKIIEAAKYILKTSGTDENVKQLDQMLQCLGG
jgi:hypothetical protein